MNKRIFLILGILAIVVIIGLAALWLSNPMTFGAAAYGMGPGMMSNGWAGFTWFGLLFGLTRVAFWLTSIVLIITLVTWIFQPKAQDQENQEA